MKEMGVIGRWALILLLLGNVYGGFAQDANTARAQHIYELFVAGQGDSIHAALNRELQERQAPALFNDSFRQAEKVFGKLISRENGRPILPRELLSIIPMWNLNVIISVFWWLLMLTGH